ncbi:MAG: AAA family ATPase [Planctomycetota bacterium]|jgi:adenylate kinase
MTQNSLFGPARSKNADGIRAVVTGQVGLDKKAFLEEVVALAQQHGHEVALFNIGELMYAEAPDIQPRRILDLPRQRLTALRRSVFKDVLKAAEQGKNIIVNTHATFRWKHGLFLAYDYAQMVELDPHLYITLVDNLDAVHERLERDHETRHDLKDILVWREEEMVVTEAMAEAVSGYGRSFVLSRGTPDLTAKSMYRLMFEPHRKRVYPSFPMTHVWNQPAVLREIDHFRQLLGEHFITSDPADVDEKKLLYDAGEATKKGCGEITVHVNDRDITLAVPEVTSVAHDIDGQIYARDFKLIEQSDMIVSFIPTMPDGRPALSSGVERELQHAFECTKEVYVVWIPDCEPSPFVTETATEVFSTLEELFSFFQQRGYVKDVQLPLK